MSKKVHQVRIMACKLQNQNGTIPSALTFRVTEESERVITEIYALATAQGLPIGGTSALLRLALQVLLASLQTDAPTENKEDDV